MDLSEPFIQLKKELKKLTTRQNIILTSIIGTLALIVGIAFYFSPSLKNNLSASAHQSSEKVDLGAFPLTVPNLKYGFALDTFQVIENEVKNGEFLADILSRNHLDYPSIDQLVKNAEGIFDFRHFRVGKAYTILTKDSTKRANYLVYEPSVYEYIVFNLGEDLSVKKVERDIISQRRVSAGVIESSLWNAMVNNGMSFELTAHMEDALQWSIDFHHVQKGDQFKLVYDENYIEGQAVGVSQVHAAYYKNIENEYYSIYYPDPEGEREGYYDLDGRPMESSFLKAPVKYSRISSYYNLNRFHPILKRRRPHFGTDYAAPYGTPIYAVGNGVVTRASYTKGNGNFVKIKHDDTYETQYLHMQKFAKGIGVGVHVKQGQVIGYVGSTGLATGPHVCFRFWKNGKQVNHLNLNFPPPEPIPDEEIPDFKRLRDEYLTQLNGIAIPKLKEETEANREETKVGGNP